MVTTYVDPGTYIERRIVPGSVSVSTDKNLAIVGIAPRTRRVTDEAVIRGKVYEESLTVAGTAPHTATLTNVSDRSKNNATIYRNGNALAIGEWSFNAATLMGGTIGGTLATTTVNQFTISLDGNDFLQISLTAGGTTALSTIVTDINSALVASSDYGATYYAVASIDTNRLVLTSPDTTSASDIKIIKSWEDATHTDAASLISNATWTPSATTGVRASTVVTILPSSYSSTATYTIDYCALNLLVDPLEYATSTSTLSDISNVGPYPGGSNYAKNTDYKVTSNTIDWATTVSANAALTCVAGPYAVTGTNDKLSIGINGGPALTVTLTHGATAVAAGPVTNINSAFYATGTYGTLYANCAHVSSTSVAFRTPAQFTDYPADRGDGSVITFYAVTNNAFTTLTGIPAASLPYEVRGVGSKPDFGTTYYVTYDYNRLSTDYTTYHAVYDSSGLYDYCSPLTATNYTVNQLAIAGELAFLNQASSLYLIQINDSTVPGTPTSTQIRAAIDVCENSSYITEIVVLDTSLDTATYLQNHISSMSSMLSKKPRRGWYGMARGTDVGDPDTSGTLIYRSRVTLQPGPTSPGRGRQILVAPTEVDRVLTLEDRSEVTVELDGSYLAVAAAAHFSSLANPSSAMVGDELIGFEIDGFETYLDAERYLLADSGVCVVTMTGGRALMLDPLTTEAGGGKDPGLEEPQSTAADDTVTRTISTLLDSNVKGVVPDDLADFIVDIKAWIKTGLEACIEAKYIGPYRNADNTARALDPATDIQVLQSTSDPRTFTFKYWYNRKYPAKRFFGEYSCDNPFFTAA